MKDVIIINLIDGLQYFVSPLSVAIISGVFAYSVNKNTQEFKKEINESNKILTKEINESNEKMQEKLSKDRIKADVVVSSRIKWIEEVRKANIDYLISLQSYRDDFSDKQKKLDFKRNSYMMMSYFPTESIQEDSDASINNKNMIQYLKNQKIRDAALVNNMIKGNISDKEYMYLKKIKRFFKFKNDNYGKNKYIYLYFAYYDRKLRHIGNNYQNLPKIYIDKEISEIINFSMSVIPLYLKIEWNRAKNNK